MHNENYNKTLNIIKLVVFVSLIATISIFIKMHNIANIDDVKRIIVDAGSLGPLVYIILFTILPTLFVTVTILAIAAGFAFGFVSASIYTFIGAFFNCTLTYFVAKYFAYDFIKDIVCVKYNNIYEIIEKKTSGKEGFVFMMMLRLLPFIPYTFLNYMSGVVGYDYFIFITSTIVGIGPGVFIYVNIGANLDGIGSIRFYVAIALLFILAIITTIIGKKMYGDELFKKSRQ